MNLQQLVETLRYNLSHRKRSGLFSSHSSKKKLFPQPLLWARNLLLFVAILQLQAFFASAMHRPAEWDHHDEIIMAWPSIKNDAYADKGGSHDLAAATRDISSIAEAVAEFEKVTLLVTPDRLDKVKKRFKHDPDDIFVQLVHDYPKLDLWMRDMAPTFVFDGCHLAGVDYNFNGWGNKYPVNASVSLASQICDNMNLTRISNWLVTEGGSLEDDGEGTLLITDGSIINENRNPGKSKQQIEAELQRTLGVAKIIWLPGIKNGDVTDGHVDGLVQFIAPGKVVMSRPNTLDDRKWSKVFLDARYILSNATDAHDRRLEVVEMVEADLYSLGLDRRTLKDIESGDEDYPSLSYVNWLLVNVGVIFPQFGDKNADDAALELIRGLYKYRRVKTVRLDQLPFLGGGIHCTTQEVPV